LGLFITLEGIEGCGKTTQAKLLADYLCSENYRVLLTREPGGPEISEKIRQLLLDEKYHSMKPETELLLYLASRAQHTIEWIIPALKDEKHVICDRYTDSTLAYQGGGRRLNTETLQQLTKFACCGIVPDLTFLIDIPVEVAIDRIAFKKKDRLEKETNSFFRNVRNEFLSVANFSGNRYIIINGINSIEAIHNEIKKTLQLRIKDGHNENNKN